MNALPARLLRTIPIGPLRPVRRFRADPVGTQERLLRGLLSRAAATEWGRRFDFAGLCREPDVVRAYQQRMPLHTYEAFAPDIQRARRGEPDVLWPGRMRHFAVSSGTASSGKVLPVSHEMLVHDRDFSVGVGLNYVAQRGSLRVLGGKHLTVPGRAEPDAQYPGTLVGEVSGLVAGYAPGFFKHLFQAVPNEVAFLPNWEEKLDAIARRAIGMDIRMIVMVPSWALVLFKRIIEHYNLRHGAHATTLGEVWPNLQVYVSGGVALSSYRSLLEALIGLPGLDFVETYGASEGFFAFQDTLADPAMLLHLDCGVFFEFVRMEEAGRSDARRYTLAEVEPGVRYTLYVSTCSGLWAYNVGDVVRFTSLAPHRIVVAGRTSEVIDKYGEKVFGEEAREALAAACTATGAAVANFHVAPRPAALDRLPAHQWLVEFEQPPASLSSFADALDKHLQRINRHYQIRREPQAFDAPEILPVPAGAFYEWMRAEGRTISGQTKVPRMSEERTIADGVLKLLGRNQ